MTSPMGCPKSSLGGGGGGEILEQCSKFTFRRVVVWTDAPKLL